MISGRLIEREASTMEPGDIIPLPHKLRGSGQGLTMRDIDCKKYEECLNSAARSDTILDCAACMMHNSAVELGRLGGIKGGPARAKALTKEQRVRIARKAALTRWGKLFACPFCHSSDLTFENSIFAVGDCAVMCNNDNCGIMGPVGKDKEQAIKKWNAEE